VIEIYVNKGERGRGGEIKKMLPKHDFPEGNSVYNKHGAIAK
jgi:hypothetical protein